MNGKNVLQPKVLEIITDFLQEDENNYKELKNNLSSYKNIFQYVYSNVFPKIYCSTEKRGFYLKSNFHSIFIFSSLGKNPENYESIRNETNIYEQKPINIDDFNEIEENEMKERVEKRKQKRREVAEKNKHMKKKKQEEENKLKEQEMVKRRGELNNEFRNIKGYKKNQNTKCLRVY